MTSRLKDFKTFVNTYRNKLNIPTNPSELLRSSNNTGNSLIYKSTTLLKSILSMYAMLTANSSKYLNIDSYMHGTSKFFEIENEVLDFTKKSFSFIEKINTYNETKTGNEYLFYEGIAAILSLYLVQITNLFTNMKNTRQQNTLLLNKILKTNIISSDSIIPTNIDNKDVANNNELIDNLTPEERNELELENTQLYQADLNEELEIVQSTESKIDNISNLMQQFTDKLLEQTSTVSNIYELTLQSKEKVNSGVKELQEAVNRGVNTRFLVMLIFITLSLTLLFLDWIQ